MSYKAPFASATDYGIVRAGTGITITDGVISGTLGLENYGFFSDTTTQANPVANAVNVATFDTTGPANGISVVGGTDITVTKAGIYTKLFTILFNKLSGGTSVTSIWLRLNGVDVAGSRQDLELSGTLSEIFTSGNFTLAMAAGDYIELCWSSPDILMSFIALPVGVTPTRPTGNSVKVTLTRIS